MGNKIDIPKHYSTKLMESAEFDPKADACETNIECAKSQIACSLEKMRGEFEGSPLIRVEL